MSEQNGTEKTQDNGRLQQIVVFRLGHEEYGMPIDHIKEVVITPAITRMPQTPSFVRGVANIRGNIIAILDLEEKFGLRSNAESEASGSNFTLVIESEEYKMGILVREVPNTLSVAVSSIENAIFTGDQSEQAYITGIVKLDKRLIIMIDIFKVIADQESQVFKKPSAQIAEA
jgi:purine-binding chemotaxis protein CheW